MAAIPGFDSARYALECLKSAGAQKAACDLRIGEKRELNVETDRLTLLRTTFDVSLRLLALTEDRKGTIAVNKLDRSSVQGAARQAVDLARSSEPDPANEIAEAQPAGEFSDGTEQPEQDRMFDRLTEFLRSAKEAYPSTILEQAVLDFTFSRRWFVNSNGVEHAVRQGYYDFWVMFTTKVGEKSSSFNGAGFSARRLERPLRRFARVDPLLADSTRQVETRSFGGKMTGEIIVTPECLDTFLDFLTRSISDYPMITGTSVFKGKLGQRIAPEWFTLRCEPLSEELVSRYFITGDGYRAQDCSVVERGVLATYLLSLYGARKTALERAVNDGSCYVVGPGEVTYARMLARVKRGVLVCRFSGGHPSPNGDFSGVAKNSFLIEDGTVTDALSETMISGNIVSMLSGMQAVSRERVNFGGSILPWALFGGVTISSK